MNDTLGDYMKELEGAEASRKAVKGKPIIARLDGRSFHTFTRGLAKPFDKDLTMLMRDTTQYLVKETNALIGYTQSDEISLVWYLPEASVSQYLFDGRFQKMNSILAAMATAYFNKNLEKYLQAKKDQLPLFDARVWQVPTLHDAYLALLWREKDAIKNSISMVAQYHFTAKQLNKVTGEEKKKMLRDIQDPWESYASRYRKGSYFMRVTETRALSEEELKNVPEKNRTNELVTRSPVRSVELKDLYLLSEKDLFPQYCVVEIKKAAISELKEGDKIRISGGKDIWNVVVADVTVKYDFQIGYVLVRDDLGAQWDINSLLERRWQFC